LIDWSPLKKGQPWHESWTEQIWQPSAHGCYLVLFLESRCSRCRQWIEFLGALKKSPQTPLPVCIIPLSDHGAESSPFSFAPETVVCHIGSSVFHRLVLFSPTAVLLCQGVIEKKWVDEFPWEYL